MTGPWRLGRHSAAKPGPLVSIWHIGDGPEDEDGRRDGDKLVGTFRRRDAERLVEIVNGAPNPEACAAYVGDLIERELQQVGARMVKAARRHAETAKAYREVPW